MNRSLITPSNDQRCEVHKLAATGAAAEDIAAQFGIPDKRFRRLFRKELRHGLAIGKQNALNALQEMALEGKNASALNFWIKSVCGWRDTGAVPGTAPAIHPKLIIGPDRDADAI